MPIRPGKEETQSEWMGRCVPEMIGTGPDKRPQDQAVAICLDIWAHRNDRKGLNKMATLNTSGRAFASSKIASGDVNKGASWSFSAEDGNALLGPGGDDWANYGKHHLGVDSSAPADTKAHWKYPFAKAGAVYRSGLIAIRQRAGQQSDDDIFAAAGSLIDKIDSKKAVDVEGRKMYSVLEVKQIDDELRFLRGVATTPTPDRSGDIVEPLGVAFKNPLPLLWQHDARQPVGQAKLGRPTEEGISFEARIPKVTEPGKLKDRLDEVWQSLKAGLVRGVSIGFTALEASFLKDGGIHFIKTEVVELSLVTIPANAEAGIAEIKAYDLLQRKDMEMDMLPEPAVDEAQAAFVSRCVDHLLNCYGGDMTSKEANAHCAIVWDNRTTAAGQMMSALPTSQKALVAGGGAEPRGGSAQLKSQSPRRVKTMAKSMTATEQISAFEAKRAASTASMEALMTKAADAAQTLDDEESREYDDLSIEVKKIDEHLKRLRDLEAANKGAAKPIAGDEGVIVSARRDPVISVKANVPKGTCFTRYAMALAASKGNRWEAQNIAKQWHDQTPEVELVLSHDMPTIMKAAIGTGTTTDVTWASPLIAYQVMASEFIELLRPATIIGRIPGLRRVPFNIQMPRTTTGSSTGWVGENAPKPVSSMAFDTVQLRWAKAAGIVVLTDELVRFSNPAAEAVVRGDMIDAMAQFLDRQFVDPSVAAVTNVSPASVTNGVSAVVRTGVNQAAFVTDVTTLLNTFLTNNLSTAGGVWIMSQRQALAFSLMLNALGQPFYPGISADGGTLLGYPVVASENVPSIGLSPADGTPIIFALPREIMLADDGQVVIDASNQASVQMDTAPDSPPTASTNMVSLWQMNMTGLRAERWINWLKRRSTAVGYISNANYA